MKRWIFTLALLTLACMAGAEETPVDMSSSLNKLSYAAGYRLGDMFQNQKLTLVPDAVIKGMTDARRNVRPALTKGEMKLILQDPKKFLAEDSDALAQKTLKEGLAFLSANAQRDKVVVRESGLQYLVVREGEGKIPQATDRVRINYAGRNLKGHVFDSTYEREAPADLAVLDLVPGMAEGLQLMKEGAKWELYIPAALAYANNGPLAAQTLVFEVELIEILP